MARVLVNLLNYRPGQIGGAETFLKKLIELLPRSLADLELRFLVPRDYQALGMQLPEQGALVVNARSQTVVRERILEALTAYRSRKIERVIAAFSPQVIVYPQQSLFPKRCPESVRAILTIYDVQHLTHPQNIPLAERCFRAGIYSWSLRRADELVCISETTRSIVRQFLPAGRGEVSVIPLGFDPGERLQTVKAANLPGPYVYYPAASFPHKNHRQLLETIGALVRKGRWRHRMVLSGWQTSHWKRLQALVRREGLQDLVGHEGFVDRSRVRALYASAEVVVFPSLHEGFGLPILEAHEFGKPVIASRLDVYRELGVPEEAMIDFSDPDQLEQAMKDAQPLRLSRSPLSWQAVIDRYAATIRRHLAS